MEDSTSDKAKENETQQRAKSEGNQCIALGVGVGGLGAAAAIGAAAVCPICYIVAPGLVGLGLYRRWSAGRLPRETGDTASTGESSN